MFVNRAIKRINVYITLKKWYNIYTILHIRGDQHEQSQKRTVT